MTRKWKDRLAGLLIVVLVGLAIPLVVLGFIGGWVYAGLRSGFRMYLRLDAWITVQTTRW